MQTEGDARWGWDGFIVWGALACCPSVAQRVLLLLLYVLYALYAVFIVGGLGLAVPVCIDSSSSECSVALLHDGQHWATLPTCR